MTQDLNQKLDALSADVDFSDPRTYSDLLGYDDPGHSDQPTDAPAPQGDTQTPAPAPAPAPTPAAPTADSSTTPAAAEEPAKVVEEVGGIATRDGKHIIPYAVLQASRQQNEALQAKVAELTEQVQKAVTAAPTATGNDLADRAAANPESLTDAEIEELATDFPALAKPLALIRSMNDKLAKLSEAPAPTPAPAPAPVAAPAPAPAARATSDEEAYDMAIVANPLIAQWMTTKGKEWDRAVAIDNALKDDKEYGAMTYTERFARVQRMVAADFDIPLPVKAKETPKAAAPAPAPAAQAQPVTAMPTLTDLGGNAVASTNDPLSGMTTGQMVDKAMSMTDEQLRQMAGLSY